MTLTIVFQQAAVTEGTAAAINHLIDHVDTHLNDGITYCGASNTILTAHSNVGYLNLNKTMAHNRAGAYTFISEYNLIPKLNGPILTIAQIIKSAMASAVGAELAALLITIKKWLPFVKPSSK